MNGTAGQLRAAILEQPGDQPRWNVYADWLDEHGDEGGCGIREFARCLAENERPIARYIYLADSAEESNDTEHVTFCHQAIAAAEAVLRGTIEDFVNDRSFDIIETEEVSSQIAITNAVMWSVDQVEVNTLQWTTEACVVGISYSASGEIDHDRPYCGDVINGNGTATIDVEEHVSFENITAEVEYEDYNDDLDEGFEEG